MATDNLAILGGRPAFEQPLHVGRPNVGDRGRLLARMSRMLDRNWLTNDGPFVQEFEQRVAEIAGVKHCIAMCNGTVALEIAIRAAALRGEVIIPSYTFIATAHALQWQEITPVFCDIDRTTQCIDPNRVEELITPRTTGIIGVHLWGRPCEVERLAEIADRHKLTLLFDAAHAFACSRGGRMVGGFGLAEIFSFHATKFLNTFEGGAVVTNDDSLAEKMRLMKNFGFAGYDNVIYIGTNGKMTEVAAAMGLTNLESVESFIAANRSNYVEYRRGLAECPGLSLIEYDGRERCNYQYIVIDVEEAAAGLTRDQLVAVLQAENVLARRYFYPGCHRMEPYRSFFPHARFLLPETESLARRILLLPTGTSIGSPQVTAICDLIRLALSNAPAVRDGLSRRAQVEEARVVS
jgi:dTDP-4-amino-4,6-dideoxygalactose transaminase